MNMHYIKHLGHGSSFRSKILNKFQLSASEKLVGDCKDVLEFDYHIITFHYDYLSYFLTCEPNTVGMFSQKVIYRITTDLGIWSCVWSVVLEGV